MATLIENFNLQRALLRHLDEIPTIRILQRTRVLSIIEPDEGRHGPWPLVHLDNDMVLRARLLVCSYQSTMHLFCMSKYVGGG